jgi:hypothetical protein
LRRISGERALDHLNKGHRQIRSAFAEQSAAALHVRGAKFGDRAAFDRIGSRDEVI